MWAPPPCAPLAPLRAQKSPFPPYFNNCHARYTRNVEMTTIIKDYSPLFKSDKPNDVPFLIKLNFLFNTHTKRELIF